MSRRVALLLLATAVASCRPVLNYPSAVGPRFAGVPPVPAPAKPHAHALRVVTYNVQWGRHVDRAINVLTTRAPLSDADIVVLQEMDEAGTRRIADALGMWWVFYPAAVHPKLGHNFGNAVLSRWPIVADEKLLLPHIGGLRQARRIATAATVLMNGVAVRVYSAHLGTQTEIPSAYRRDQAVRILDDAAAYPLVIVAGDMNSHGIGHEFVASGFAWPTEHDRFTTALFNWDHIFFKGFAAGDPAVKSAGVVRDTLGTSDHDPVWAVARFP